MNTKVKCLLLDDELPGLAYTRMLCEQMPGVEVVKAFNDPVKFLGAVNTLDFNLCILDIEMPGVSGLEVAKLLSDKLVIFTTAYKEHAAEAFDLSAVDYIRKPLQKERFEKAILKAASILSNDPGRNYCRFNTDKGKSLLLFDEILLVSGSDTDKRDKIAWLENQQRVILKNISFEQLQSILPKEKFCRVNKKDLISIKAVRSYSHDEIITRITTRDNVAIKVALTETYRADFNKLI